MTTSTKPLEAVFLSTFVMISQNRADAKRQVIADQQWQTVKEEDRQNEELLNPFERDPQADEGDPFVHESRTGRRPATEVVSFRF